MNEYLTILRVLLRTILILIIIVTGVVLALAPLAYSLSHGPIHLLWYLLVIPLIPLLGMFGERLWEANNKEDTYL